MSNGARDEIVTFQEGPYHRIELVGEFHLELSIAYPEKGSVLFLRLVEIETDTYEWRMSVTI